MTEAQEEDCSRYCTVRDSLDSTIKALPPELAGCTPVAIVFQVNSLLRPLPTLENPYP